ncbi:MAG: hypothetical protein ACRDHI_12270, partial [Actinomycetota bacterium]
MRASVFGSGARAALHGAGRVVAWFPRACYVSMPSGVIALVSPDVQPGPIHVVLDRPLPPTASGADARLVGHRLLVDGRPVALAGAEEWRG